jgi:TetR/AcrR family transcriptional repressor of nem operon
MDAAERRIRRAGYGGFSFREIAVDVGIKNASVHHHFPTKGDLAAAVARRYADRFLEAVEREAKGIGRVQAWRRLFRQALVADGHMCMCGILGSAPTDLPPEVVSEARQFFLRGLEDLGSDGAGALPPNEAKRVMATLEGAMLLATALGDISVFDEATTGLDLA